MRAGVHQDLEHRRRLRVPELARLAARPRAEEREADLAILVEGWVDALAVREVVDGGRLLRELGRELQVEDEDAILVGGARPASHEVRAQGRSEHRRE